MKIMIKIINLPIVLSALISLLIACDKVADPVTVFQLSTASNRADMVSGDTVLLSLQTNIVDLDSITFQLNGEPVMPIVKSDQDKLAKTLLLGGLQPAENTVTASYGGKVLQTLTVTSHPISGPVFSGRHQEPYLCLSQLAPDRDGNPRAFAIGNGENLDLSQLDDNCHLPTRVDYVYVSTDPNKSDFQPLADPQSLPADVAMVELQQESIPFVVQLETGTINRAIYQIATLVGGNNSNTWNGRLLYTFGGGCEAGFHQGTSTAGVLRQAQLAEGYAIASSTLNVNRQGGCNDVISAETAMMVKEHFIETYGIPAHTIGLGGSGGAMQQHLIANNYPGILDGLIVGVSFPDPVTYFMDSAECALPLRSYLNNLDVSDEVKTAIGGWQQWSTCDVSLGQRPARISPYDCAAEIPPQLAYDEVNNPTGIRCSIYDGMKNVFGQIPHPRLDNLVVAPSPHDNIGVQYGLRALQAGLISKELFLDLNEQVGGWDIDYQPRPERTQADAEALAKAYSTGRIVSGKNLANIPIIDDRTYLDSIGNFHTSVYSFSLRARLLRDNGHADNQIIRRHPRELNLTDDNVQLMDQWLTNVEQIDGQTTAIDKIRQAKPENLADDCFSDEGKRIVEPAVYSEADLFQAPRGQCNTLFPVHSNPRIVAGAPLTGDVMKCQLKPINWREYGVEFSDAEKQRLNTIFPDGVCDWTAPGVGQAGSATWLSY